MTLSNLTLAQLPVPVATHDRETRFVAANESMSRLMGMTEDEMRGLTLWLPANTSHARVAD